MTAGIQLIVGLGNPGSQYEKTRHNVGAWFVDYLAQQYGESLTLVSKLQAKIAKVNIDGAQCLLAVPTTYMNESGRSVSAIARFYKIPTQSILVVHDELDFDVGIARLKYDGGHGGHNGLRDIKKSLSGSDFYRLRIGIGHPGHKDSVSPYVLKAPSRSDRADIITAIDEASRIVPELVEGQFERAFHTLHSDSGDGSFANS